jgi:hypothetical protein
MLYELPVNIQTQRIQEPGIDVLYPVVTGMSDTAAQQQMNQIIAQEVNRLIRQHSYPPGPNPSMTGSYEIKTNERGVLSLILFTYAFSGGASGTTLQQSLTFDIYTGNPYSFEDLFVHGADYAPVINRLIQQQIRERHMPLKTEFAGVRPDQTYYIADKSLVIWFQENELMAAVYGIPYFPISVYDIQDIINEHPLGEMMA